jgi:2-oxoglutarate ferredoxin oxidoreductase subunit delta
MVEKSKGVKKRRDVVIEIDYQSCRECGICVEFCKPGVLVMNASGKPEVVEESNCTVCRLCELRCPDLAIRVNEREKQA